MMEHLKFGHDNEGFPTQHINRNMRHSGTTVVPPVTVSHGLDVADIEYQIHCIETEAYSAVLRAFTAQSDVLTWDKEGLISNLRKELRVSNIEHRELLVKVDSDDFVRMIREWRNGIASQNKILSDTIAPSVPGSVGQSFDKRRTMSHVTTSSSLNYLPYCQPGSAIPSSLATHFRESQLGREAATSFRMGNLGQPMKSVGHDGKTSLLSKGRGPVIDQPRKDPLPSDITNLKKSSDIITIRATDRLIREVERLINEEKLDSVPVEKAKLLLRDHEREILEALDKLSHVSDNDDSPNKHGYSHQERKGRQKIKLRLGSLPSARV